MGGAAISVERPVAIIGAGTMGRGIARVAAAAGHRVYLCDAQRDAVVAARRELAERLARAAEKGRIDRAEADAILERVVSCSDLSEVADAGLVVEAVFEDLTVKRELLARVEDVVTPETIIATNTSSLSVTAVAAGARLPRRVAGMHFFNPAPVMPLVEVVAGSDTAAETVDVLVATAAAWGKTAVRCASTPGFIVNRVARPFYGEALRLLEEGVASVATIDAVLVQAGGFRMGPFTLMDLVGLDVNLAVSRSVYEQTFHEPRFAPSVIQQGLVDAGHLGRKTGRGFFDYTTTERVEPDTAPPAKSPREVLVHGELGWAAGLLDRLVPAAVPVAVVREGGPGYLIVDGVCLVPTDGRAATEVAAAGSLGTEDVVVLDLVHDWERARRVAIAVADQARVDAAAAVAGLLQVAGLEVSVVDDSPALVVMRTVAQLAAGAVAAADAGVASPADIDTAMRLGTNYPAGPLEWADRIGMATVVTTLANLAAAYGEDRYRVPRAMRRAAVAGKLGIGRKGPQL
jgi:3-hydroxybutyryl-CoA dehydrogenase